MKKNAIDNLAVKMGCTTKFMPDESYVISDEEQIPSVGVIPKDA